MAYERAAIVSICQRTSSQFDKIWSLFTRVSWILLQITIFFVNSTKERMKWVNFTKKVPKSIFSRTHHAQKIYSHWENISSNQFFGDFFSKNVAFTKLLPKCLGVNFWNYHTVLSKFPHYVIALQWKLFSRNYLSKLFFWQIFREINFLPI